ncbi:pilus assembly protein PilM [Candidatus Omnitrophota bacterium]
MAHGFITAIEITDTHIKLAQAKKDSKGVVVTALRAVTIHLQADDSISKQLGALLDETKIKPSNVICIIPRKFVIARTLKLPSHDKKEIEKMAALQAAQQIPYPKEDIVSDYITLEKDAEGYARVLLAMVHKDVVSRYLKIFSDAGIEPGILTLSSQGICSWYAFFSAGDKQAKKERAVLIDVNTANSDICFYHDGNVVSSRSVSFGSTDINEGKIDEFLQQLRLTISAYQKENSAHTISRIVMLSHSETIKNFSLKIEGELPFPVECVDIASAMSKTKGASMATMRDTSPVVVIGHTLQKEKQKFNFLPLHLYSEKRNKIIRKELVTCAALFVACVVVIVTAVLVKLNKDERYVAQLESMIQETTPEARKLESAVKKLEIIKQRMNPGNSSIDVIYELYDLLPTGMGINVFNLDESNNLTLQGMSLAMSEVFKFQSLLEKSDNFTNVEVKYASKRRIRGGEVTDFRILCQIATE